MSISRFENRLTGQAMSMDGLVGRVTASQPSELNEAFDQIEQARHEGHWISLLLDYELGEWLEPALSCYQSGPDARHQPQPDIHPRLTALIYRRMTLSTPWMAEGSTLPHKADPKHDAPSRSAQDQAEERLPSALSEPAARIISVTPCISREQYIKNIDQIRDWIAQGDVYQVNSTFPLDVVTQGNPASLYGQLASQHPSAFSAYIEDEERTVLSFSPELFLKKVGSKLITRPMKGTAPRSDNPVLDQEIGQKLLNSQKDRAENLMIVDLLRNDLGRVAVPGSVKVDALFTLEKYASVWTMTSTIQARVRQGITFKDILRAMFPCGSVTGAPKIAAMRRIRQTETHRRGLYCGSLGWMSPSGDFELNVAIRTLVIDTKGKSRYHVGSGIVYDSVPAKEWEECQWKARILGSEQWTFPPTPL